MRCHFRDGLMKRIVEAGKMDCRRKDRLSRGNQLQRLRDMQRREMCRGAKLVDHLRCDSLMGEKFGPPVHYSMTHSHWRSTNMFLDGRRQGGQGINLGFEDTF